MKWIRLFFQPVSICLIIACTSKDPASWQKNLEGTYITHYQQAYSIGWDTLIIRSTGNAKKANFQILKHTIYQRIHNGKKEAPFFTMDTWRAEPDNDAQTLITYPAGRRYEFDESTNTLRVGNTIYQKLK